jgi:predicted N-acetyltransferase YhbS
LTGKKKEIDVEEEDKWKAKRIGRRIVRAQQKSISTHGARMMVAVSTPNIEQGSQIAI